MPIGPDTDRRGSGRNDRNLLWEDTSMERVGGGTIPEFRHQGEDFKYIARYSPDYEGTETPWVASIHDDSGRYSSVSGHATDLADAQSLAVAYHQNEWQPGTEKDLQNPDNPDYVAEGTQGQPGLPPPPPPVPPRQSRSSEEAQVEAHTPGYGPDEKFWRKGEQQKDTDDARKWQEGKKFDRKMEEKTGRSSPPRPFPESRFTPDGETKIPAPPRQDGLSHQRTPSDAARVKAGPPPPVPPRHIPSRPPPSPPPR